MSASCPRSWQAEAVQDGRLSRSDEQSFERHAETCRECRDERAALEQLRLVASRLPALESTPLRRRFLHNELLRRANERALGGVRARLEPRRTLAAVAACVVLALVALFAVAPRFGAPTASVVDEPEYRVLVSPGARWKTRQRGPDVRVVFSEGRFDVSVRKLHVRQSFVVALPDGELEVRGTRFEVDVRERTRRVAVSEGLVALRLRGEPARALGPGDSWTLVEEAPAAPPRPAPSPPASAAPAEGDVVHPSPRPPAPKSRAPRAPSSAAGAEQNVEAREGAPAHEFAAAMAAFSRGDFATAEQLFLAFEARHPANARVEDTLFLRALGRLKRGDTVTARALAAEYLRRYPAGFRRREAERMAQ